MKKGIREKIRQLNEKQKKRLKTALIMSLMCIVLLSGATYAWFTIANKATVNRLALQVVSDGRLYIADSRENITKKESSLDLTDSFNKVLYPCTTEDGKTMKKPVYSDNNHVNASKPITEDEKSSYYYETDLWLMVEETLAENADSNYYDITLGKADGADGTTINTISDSHPEYCLRMSFECGDTIAVYEPHSDEHLTGTEGVDYAYNTLPGLSSSVPLHKQLSTGKFGGETGTVYYEGDSSALFTIKGNEPVKVTVRIWFEGTDKDCMNEIQAEKIEGMLKFVSHRKTN